MDQTVLQMSERQGVEIDYCPTCRGVWLDRGELDKIIDRADAATSPQPSRPQPPTSQGYVAQPYPSSSDATRGYDNRGYEDRRSDPRHRPKKKESFLGDLFDF